EERIDFGPPVGTLVAHHTIHSEPITFWHAWKDQGLSSATWKLALPPDFTAQMKFLARIGMTRLDKIDVGDVQVRPRDVLLKVVGELPEPTGTNIEITTVVVGVVRGLADGREVEWRVRAVAPPPEGRPDAGVGMLTGVSPAIVAKMLARGDIQGPGVFVPEQVVPPEEFFAELAGWGVTFDASMREVIA
ncbi:MAG TPA: saccharopine dehydrogenase C-terminal domain-containing protein, partial [Thermoleophilia bacterium]|nr:saccharopine dehydrogenase C-terminal domain-containing protein [Thermoleophilia bacterium]